MKELIKEIMKVLLKDKQIIIVEFEKPNQKGHQALTFLVDNVDHPQVPGYPANALCYYSSVADARSAIIKLYDEYGYPHYTRYLDVWRQKMNMPSSVWWRAND